MYLLGEPIFNVFNRKRFQAPIGQADLCLGILQRTQNLKEVKEKLHQEYLAICWALVMMGIDFRIVYAHEKQIDKLVLAVCTTRLGCRLAGFGENFFPPAVAFPRDFCTIFPGLLLVNQGVKLLTKEKNGYRLETSPYGEGGLALSASNLALVCERVPVAYNKDGFRLSNESDLRPLKEAGLSVGLFPAFICSAIINQEISNRVFSNNHLDRVSGLLRGQDGGFHLIVDPRIVGTDWTAPATGMPWRPVPADELVPELQRRYKDLGVTVHTPAKLSVPYSLNFQQFPDGRVLMTSGDEEVEKLVRSIVGDDKVFVTEIPIRHYPAWLYAGIRCLIGDFPEPLFNKVQK